MRFLTLLLNNNSSINNQNNNKQVINNQNNVSIEKQNARKSKSKNNNKHIDKLKHKSNNENNNEQNNKDYHFYDYTLYEKYKLMNYIYNNDHFLQENFKKIVPVSHPFELTKSLVSSSFIPKGSFKITNAFMKLWELLKWLDSKELLENMFNDNKLLMYDVAGAPGMFVLSAETYLKKYYPNINLDWYACSLEGGTALTDTYGLYKNNPKRYSPCDVLKEEDINKCIDEQKNKKYKLVTGDIGIYHEDDYDHLQEEKQLDIEWGQMVLAINLVDNGGIMILKMYSLITLESIYLLDTLSKHFKHIYITKPYCTRIFNDECYIICIDKNNKSTKDIPLLKPYISDYKSYNIELVRSFEYSRLDAKFRLIYLIEDLLKDNVNKKIYELRSDKFYNVYYKEISDLYKELCDVDKIWPKNNNKQK